MQRFIFQIFLLAFGILYIQSYSTLFYVVPIWAVSCVAAIRNDNKSFDFIDMFWLLNQLSFVVAPLVTLRENVGSSLFAQGAIMPLNFGQTLTYRQDQVIELYFIIFIVTVINAIILPRTYRYDRAKNIDIKFSTRTLLIIFVFAVCLEIVMRGGLLNTLAARRFKTDASGGLFLIFSRTLTLAISLFLAGKLTTDRSWMKLPGYIVLFGLILLLYNPFNASRFALLQATLPLILITFPQLTHFKVFSFSIIGGMMVVMPILSETTRRGVGADIADVNVSPAFFLGYLDQHKVILHLIAMVEEQGYQFGRSILSVTLFFVPRSLWPDKPLVLGLEVGNELFGAGLVGTANLSGPIFGDFYYDFGILGVIIGSIITAYLVRRFLTYGETLNGLPVVGLFLLGALPILFRGTVGAIIPITAFTLFFYYALLFIQTRVRWRK